MPKILKFDVNNSTKELIEFPDPAYSCYISSNPDYEAKEFLYGYTSLRKPSSVFSLNLELIIVLNLQRKMKIKKLFYLVGYIEREIMEIYFL